MILNFELESISTQPNKAAPQRTAFHTVSTTWVDNHAENEKTHLLYIQLHGQHKLKLAFGEGWPNTAQGS